MQHHHHHHHLLLLLQIADNKQAKSSIAYMLKMRLGKVKLCLLMLVLLLNIHEIYGTNSPSADIQSGTALAEARNFSEIGRQSDNTVRADPLKGLRKYRGGYDITNIHYWSSTAYTGIPGYTLGVLWLLCGIVYGIYLLYITYRSTNNQKHKKKQRSPCQQQCYLKHILLGTSFAVLAIIASGVVLGGNAKFHSRAKKVVDIIIDTADEASEILYNTTGAMKGMSSSLEAANTGGDTSQFLSSTSVQLDSRAADLQRQAKKNRVAIHKGLEILYIVTTVVISVNLVAVIAMAVLGLLKFRKALHLLIAFCWFVTIFCWLFFGIYFFIGKFAQDTCTALEHFQEDPYNNSLSEILPCNQLLSAQSVLSDVSAGVYDLVNEVNANISRIQGSSYFHICNPFSSPPEYNYTPDNCSPNAVRIGDIPQFLRLITCIDSENGVCNGGIPISSSDFMAIEAYTTSIQTLMNSYPGMESLVDCKIVENTFTEILDKHCKPLKRYAKMVWISMVFLSTTMVVLLVTWALRVFHDRKRNFSDGSVKPHATTTTDVRENSSPERKVDDVYPNCVV